jgi:hypothetical protein
LVAAKVDVLEEALLVGRAHEPLPAVSRTPQQRNHAHRHYCNDGMVLVLVMVVGAMAVADD